MYVYFLLTFELLDHRFRKPSPPPLVYFSLFSSAAPRTLLIPALLFLGCAANFLNSRHLNGQIEDTRYSGVTGTPGDDSYSIARVSSPPPGDQLGVEEEDEDEAPTKPAFAEDNDGQGFQSDVREVHPADPTRPTFREMMRSIFWNRAS